MISSFSKTKKNGEIDNISLTHVNRLHGDVYQQTPSEFLSFRAEAEFQSRSRVKQMVGTKNIPDQIPWPAEQV